MVAVKIHSGGSWAAASTSVLVDGVPVSELDILSAAFIADDRAGMQAGADSNSSTVVVANRAYFRRFVPERDMSIVNFGIVVHTADAGNPGISCSIHAASDLTTPIVTTGTVAGLGTTTGRKLLPCATTALTAGTVYYAGVSTSSSTLVLAGTNPGHLAAWEMYGSTAPNLDGALQNSKHPISGALTLATGATVYPSIWLLET